MHRLRMLLVLLALALAVAMLAAAVVMAITTGSRADEVGTAAEGPEMRGRAVKAVAGNAATQRNAGSRGGGPAERPAINDIPGRDSSAAGCGGPGSQCCEAAGCGGSGGRKRGAM